MKYIDLHCDTISELMGREGETLVKNRLCLDVAGMEKAGTGVQFFACFVNAGKYAEKEYLFQEEKAEPQACWDLAYNHVLQMADRIDKEQSDKLKVVKTFSEVEQQIEKGCICAVKTVEEGGILNNRLDRLETLYKKGIRLMTLTWNYKNCLAYPNAGTQQMREKGLTKFGIEVVKKMNEMGMLIDVSHLSDGGFWDCMHYSSRPICASHSNARALCSHPRNLTDDMLKALGEKGGVAGLNFYPPFLKKESSMTAELIAKHAIHLIDKGGEALPAIGSDLDGFTHTAYKNEICHVSDMLCLWDAMKKNGITERQLDRIMWQNAMRIMKEI